MKVKKTVVIGFLGAVLDEGRGNGRWEKWRPSISLCQQEDLLIDRLELFYQPDRYQRVRETVAKDIAAISPETELVWRPMPLDDPWDFEQVYAALHGFARDYPFEPEQEEYLIHITTGTHVAQICLFLLTEANYFPARLLQSAPPPKQRAGKVGSFTIIDLDLSRYDRIAQRFAEEREETLNLLKSGIATRNLAFNRMIDAIEKVANRSPAPILLLGPTGAGKSFLARQVYQLKRKRHQVTGPFVEVNCATLHGEGTMSALFGHTKGAYTGSVGEREGLLRQADGGLLFLDEIGELGLDEQSMLLKAIEEKRFYPMGSDHEVESHFQLIAGTCRDLRIDVEQGRFREDLYARINLWTFHLPGLVDRPEDIEPNLEFELERQAGELGRRLRFNKPARQRYLAYATAPDTAWRGNFRELSASVSRLATLAEGGRITESDVEDEIIRLRNQWRNDGTNDDGLERLLSAETLAQIDLFDRCQLDSVIKVCAKSGTLSEAGRTLFNASRQRKSSSNDADRLRKYLAKFDLTWERVRSE
ncbi:MAG: RNA repair transcriptional activator RtcR [Candidatus Thiodiazotropha sp. 6PLUC2]